MGIVPDSGGVAETTRSCRTCMETKSLGDFYVKVRKTGRLSTQCKRCDLAAMARRPSTPESRAKVAAWTRARRAANPEKTRADNLRYDAANREKRCKAAKERRDRDIEGARAREREREATPEQRASRAAQRARNADKIKARHARYRKENAAKVAAYNDAYRRTHPELYVAATKKWQTANPVEVAIFKARSNHRRRSLEAALPNDLTAAQWKAIIANQGNRCLLCGKSFDTENKPSKDHATPLSRGGGLTASNVVAVCCPCNSRKRTLTLDEFWLRYGKPAI